MSKHMTKAQAKVTKAVNVFSQAIKEVEQAQELLKQGVQDDVFKVASLEKQIDSINEQIKQINKDKAEKGKQMKSNTELLEKLKEFQS